ncbi:dTMP kinase [Carnobacteriaceae bacterium zg-ZUI252]|nr:dTMP kinase [Carnobacteriaceae bacterium zg-ZUI252]
MRGIFVTFEGPEGAGKTTLIQQLYPVLEKQISRKIKLTREPGGNMIAETIRQVILNPAHTQMDSRTEALLYAASRRQHLVDNVIPALNDGGVILCDRFVDSSIAYQGYARGIGVDGVMDINHFATDGMQPDITFYLDIDVTLGLERIQKHRTNEMNRLDFESLEFHEKVRQGYLNIAQSQSHRVVVLDATQATDELVKQCVNILLQRFPEIFKTL